eukprot:907468-Prorocentrum_minimum.AAC.6
MAVPPGSSRRRAGAVRRVARGGTQELIGELNYLVSGGLRRSERPTHLLHAVEALGEDGDVVAHALALEALAAEVHALFLMVDLDLQVAELHGVHHQLLHVIKRVEGHHLHQVGHLHRVVHKKTVKAVNCGHCSGSAPRCASAAPACRLCGCNHILLRYAMRVRGRDFGTVSRCAAGPGPFWGA